jgi:hypothetical protein
MLSDLPARRRSLGLEERSSGATAHDPLDLDRQAQLRTAGQFAVWRNRARHSAEAPLSTAMSLATFTDTRIFEVPSMPTSMKRIQRTQTRLERAARLDDIDARLD